MPTSTRTHPHPTLGFLGPVSDFFINQFWQQALAAAHDENANLIGFATENIWYSDERKHFNLALYQQIHAGNIDGLLSTEFMRLPHLPDMPGVQIAGVAPPGIPSVEIDHTPGARAAVAHLVEVHGLRRIALAMGPDEDLKGMAHYRGYCQGLADQGIPLEDNLILPHGTHSEATGWEAVRLLLDERGVPFQAVMASRDDIAIGVMKALQARGLRVPEDVAVIGAHNTPEGRRSRPPVTTSSGPRGEQLGTTSVKLVLAQLRGQPVPAQNFLPSELWIRQSCGCFPAAVRLAGDLVPESLPQNAEALTPNEAKELEKAFRDEVEGGYSGAYLGALRQLLNHSAKLGSDQLAWQNALSVIRRQTMPRLAAGLHRQAESLWQQGRVLVAEMTDVAHAQHVDDIEKLQERLLGISQRLLTAFELKTLLELLPHELPILGIPGCYITLHEPIAWPPEYSRLVLAWDERGCLLLDPAGRRFPAAELLPKDFLPKRRFDLLAVPLFYREEHLGTVIFEAGPPDAAIYLALAQALSSALKVTLLYQAAEEADRLKSRFLATVSHELRTPLNLIVGLSEILLQEPASPDESPATARHRADLEQIHVSAQHLGRLIRDVLDLASNQAGQLKLNREPLSMTEVLDVVVAAGEQLAHEKNLHWEAQIAPNLPKVWGDRTRLRQVGLNLVSNAVKFTERGKVTLTVELEEISNEAACILVSITDTGLGIPLAEQQLIFDEFRQSERTSARGFGGLGLGLAVSKRLVELHGGSIGVLSSGQEQAGSTFYFRLPVLEEARPSLQPRASKRQQTVFVLFGKIDGEERLRSYLVQQGFRVEAHQMDAATNWLSSLVAAPPGAVVLDSQVASEQGWEILKVMKTNPATNNIPVLFYALPDGQETGALLELDYLAKPINAPELAQAIAQYGLLATAPDETRTILVVDDEPGTLDMHARMVQSLAVPPTHYQVLKARNGREALVMMRESRPDLVLLDLMMPELDGFRVLEIMRQETATRDIPVLVLTAQVLTESDMARLNRGVAAVLEKGVFSVAETLAHVKTALSQQRKLRAEIQQSVRKAMAYLHEHYAEAVTREEVARHVGVSESHLTRCFRKETGVPLMIYLNRLRVRQAKVLLSSRRKSPSITEVAIAVGFPDVAYFSKVFRRETGMTPSAFQALARQTEVT